MVNLGDLVTNPLLCRDVPNDGEEDYPNLLQVMSDIGDLSKEVALYFSSLWRQFHQVECTCGHIWAYST
jgi:hypothetical protein